MNRDESGAVGLIIVLGIIYYIWKGISWLGAHPLVLWGSVFGLATILLVGWYFWYKLSKKKERENADKYRLRKIEDEERQVENARKEVAKQGYWNQIRNMSSRDFEKFIAQLYQLKGYQVELTPATGDGGKDVILRKNGSVVYVECKHWKNKVGEPEVRSLLGAMARDGVEKGIFVTISDFTASARRMASSKIQLINKDALLSMIVVSQKQ